MTSLGVIQCNYHRWSACYQFPWYSTRRRVVQTGAACAARTRGAACTGQRDRATRWSAAIDRTGALGYAEEPAPKVWLAGRSTTGVLSTSGCRVLLACRAVLLRRRYRGRFLPSLGNLDERLRHAAMCMCPPTIPSIDGCRAGVPGVMCCSSIG